MFNFKRMKDDLDDMSTQVTSKLPGRTVHWLIVLLIVFIIFIIGFGIGYGSGRKCSGADCFFPNASSLQITPGSCPRLEADNLITTIPEGKSFEGLRVNLQCSNNMVPFPLTVVCRRRPGSESGLEWSGIPVCYPESLLTPGHWNQTLHARMVTCEGDSMETKCSLQCVRNFIAVERKKYSCMTSPCKAWTIEDKQCYRCDQQCEMFHKIVDPSPREMLRALTCDSDCERIVVSSNGPAAVWQNKRTGLFHFMGEHNGRPLYQNNVTAEYLYYTVSGAEWLVGPDFRRSHAGIQLFMNDDKSCPERHGGESHTKVYIDSSKPLQPGENMWRNDSTISFQCYRPGQIKVAQCSCRKYRVYYTSYSDDSVPELVENSVGTFRRIQNTDEAYGLLAPLYFSWEKNLYLFSHHPAGLVWQISAELTTTPIRGVFSSSPSCPDSDDIVWEWYNSTTPLKQQIYVKDDHIKVECIEGAHGA